MKRIVLYIDPDAGPRGRVFLDRVQQRVSGFQVQACQSIDSFVKAVGRDRSYLDLPVVVLFVAGRDRLQALYRKKQWFADSKVVMVVPREKTFDGTVLIHRFFPRYVAVMDDRYDDLCDVLDKMMVQ
jgi:hypothetical protein